MSYLLVNYEPKIEKDLVGNQQSREKIDNFFVCMREDNKRRSIFATMIRAIRQRGIYINISNDIKQWANILNLSIWKRLNTTQKKLFIQKKLMGSGRNPLIKAENFRVEKQLFDSELILIINMIDTLASIKILTGRDSNPTTLIVYGKECSGKTCAVRVLGKKHGFDIQDYVSDKDIAENFKDIVNIRTQGTNSMTGNILTMLKKSQSSSDRKTERKIISCTLFDDLNNVANGGNALTGSILKLIHPFHKSRNVSNFEKSYSQVCTKIPCICILSGSKTRSLKELEKSCKSVEFKELQNADLRCILCRIITGESISITERALDRIITFCTSKSTSSLRLAVDILIRARDIQNIAHKSKIQTTDIEQTLNTHELNDTNNFDSIFDILDDIIYKYNQRDLRENMRIYSKDCEVISSMMQINYPQIMNEIHKKNKNGGCKTIDCLYEITRSFEELSYLSNSCYLNDTESQGTSSLQSVFGLLLPMHNMIKACSNTTKLNNTKNLPQDFPYHIKYMHLGTHLSLGTKLSIGAKSAFSQLGEEYINLWLHRLSNDVLNIPTKKDKEYAKKEDTFQRKLLEECIHNRCSPKDLLSMCKLKNIRTLNQRTIKYVSNVQDIYEDKTSGNLRI